MYYSRFACVYAIFFISLHPKKQINRLINEFKVAIMGNAFRKNEVEYNAIMSNELSHYMTLDEMHERLVAKIRSHFAEKV